MPAQSTIFPRNVTDSSEAQNIFKDETAKEGA